MMTNTENATAPKIRMAKIEFQMVEGRTGSPFMRKQTFYTWDAVNAHITRARLSDDVPERGYNKCDFTVIFEDGQIYEGRFDLSKDPGQDTTTLDGHIRQFNAFYAGEYRPTHMSEVAYNAFLARSGEERAIATEFLNKYSLSDDRRVA